MTVFSVFMPLQDMAQDTNWFEGVSLKDDKLAWKLNVRIMKAKLNVKIRFYW